MVFLTDAIDMMMPESGDVKPKRTVRKRAVRKTKRNTRLGSRKSRGKVSKRASRKTKMRATRRRNQPKVKYTRATTLRKLREGRKIRFATRRTRVFKPIMASDWQVEHQEFGIGPLKKGDLSQYGYASDKKVEERHKALKKASKKYGSTSVFRKLNALYVYNKNKSPERANTFKADRDFVKAELME